MQKKYLLSLIVIGLLLFGSLGLAVTYSLWKITDYDNSIAINNEGCVKIIYSDSDTFNLVNPKSLDDEDGVISTPRSITINNNCTNKQNVELHLDVLNSSTIDDNKIKLYVNGEFELGPTLLSNLRYVDGTNNIKKTYRLFKYTIDGGDTKRINFRLWLDQDAAISNDKNVFDAKYYVSASEMVLKPSLAEVILSNNKDDLVSKGVPDYSKVAYDDEGLYKSDNGYYYRGSVSNNYVSFADKLWRIVGINSDNTVKLIYQGNDLTSNYYDDASNENNVGYTNNSEMNNTSNMKTYLDNWYSNNLSKYDEYINLSNYCNDTTSSGYGRINYSSYTRNFIDYTPSNTCEVTDKSYGGNYNQKIGLITLDEVSMAGGNNGLNNTSYYLNDGNDFYTMSPAFYTTQAYIGIVTRTGKIDAVTSNQVKEVRPVINLINSATITGDGTINNPYLVDDIN